MLALEGPVWAATAEQPWSKLTLGAVMALLSSDREQTLAEGSRGEESEHTLTLVRLLHWCCVVLLCVALSQPCAAMCCKPTVLLCAASRLCCYVLQADCAAMCCRPTSRSCFVNCFGWTIKLPAHTQVVR